MLCSFLSKYPPLQGTVLDLPGEIEKQKNLWSDRLNVDERCMYCSGDMFANVPNADAYTMKMILHDWNDDECIQILGNVAEAASPGTRVFIAEHVVPDPDTAHFSKLFDIHMMCWGTGRERTENEYKSLLEKAGWEHVHTWFPESRMIGVVEGVIAQS